MAGGWQIGSAWANPQDPLGAATIGIASGGAANQKGSWVQIAAATSDDAQCVGLQWVRFGSNYQSLDIGIGPAGSEIPLVSDLYSGGSQTYPLSLFLPLSIPKGTRVAVRSQATAAFVTAWMHLFLISDRALSNGGSGAMDTYGFNSAATMGTPVDPGTTASVKGAWTQLAASVTANLAGFFMAFDTQNRTSGSANNDVYVDIGIGPSGSEVPVLSNFYNTNYFSGTQMVFPYTPFIPIQIPAGSRIAARCATPYTAADRTVGMTLYGVRQ